MTTSWYSMLQHRVDVASEYPGADTCAQLICKQAPGIMSLQDSGAEQPAALIYSGQQARRHSNKFLENVQPLQLNTMTCLRP